MEFQQNAVHYLMSFLAEIFSDLADRQCLFQQWNQSIHRRSEVNPMKILFKDEKLKSDMIDILTQLMIDANLDGSPQVLVYVYMHM